jgi:predicted aspartyl protease
MRWMKSVPKCSLGLSFSLFTLNIGGFLVFGNTFRIGIILLLLLPQLAFSPGPEIPLNSYRAHPVLPVTISFPTMNSAVYDPFGKLETVTIPLKRIGKLFLIEASVDNQIGNFVFDTGSSRLVLNTTYFRKYLTLENAGAGGVTGTVAKTGRVYVKRIQLAGLEYSNTPADVTNLGHIEDRRGVRILGLFGFSMFKNMEIVIDANRNELRLFRLDKKGNRITPVGRPGFDMVQEFVVHQDVIFLQAKIGGKVLDFCLDTGAESNVLNSQSSKKVLGTVSIQRRSSLVGAGSARREVLYGVMNDFTMGDHSLANMQTIITSLENMSESYGFSIDGMLGYDFFNQGEICINMVRNEMGVWLTKKR